MSAVGNRFMRTDFWVRRVMRRGNVYAIFASLLLRWSREQPQAVRTWQGLRCMIHAQRRELERTRKKRETEVLELDRLDALNERLVFGYAAAIERRGLA